MNAPIRTVVIGDSWNAGWDDILRADTGGWAAMLSKDRFAVKNLSVSGATAEQWAHDFGGRLSQAVALAPECDCYIVSLGGNDAYAYIQEGSAGGATVTDAERGAGMADMLKVLSTLKATGKRVLVMLYANPYKDNLVTAIGCDILNMGIRLVAQTAGIEERDLIVSQTVLAAGGMMSGVGIHPTSLGYSALAELIEGMLS